MKLKSADNVFAIPFFAGLTLQLFAINLFRQTFISAKVGIGFYFFSGLLAYVFLHRKITRAYENNLFERVASLIYFIVSFGGCLTFILLGANYYFAGDKLTRRTVPIIQTGTLGKGPSSHCSQPYAVIESNGLSKEVIFSCSFTQSIAHFRYVVLTTNEGGLGFDVIEAKSLLK